MSKERSYLDIEASTTKHFNTPTWKLAFVISSLGFGVFLLGLDVNIVGVAIPKITTDFKSLDDVAWYASAYLLTITAFQPLFGNLYKFFNAKTIYLASIALFEVGSVVCATAPKSSVFIFGRAFLGFGGAGLLQGALSIIGHSVALEKVPMFQGIVLSGYAISVCVGPIIGGVLADHINWRWCFYINVPIGAAVFLCVAAFVSINANDKSDVNQDLALSQKLRHMDFLGTIAFLGAVCCLVLALQMGGHDVAWNSATSVGLFVGCGLLILIFGVLQWHRGEYATIPPRIFKKRSIYMGALVLFFLGMSTFTYGVYLPIYFQSIQGASATQSGVRFLSVIIPQMIGVVVVGGFVSKWGSYMPYLLVGIVITSIGSGLLTLLSSTTSTTHWALFMLLEGLGMGIAQQVPYHALQAVLPKADIATGNAIAVFSSQLGMAIAIAIANNVFLDQLAKSVLRYTTAVSPVAVVAAGAGGLVKVAGSREVLEAVRLAYADALRGVWIFAVVTACVAFPCALGMEWLNIKTVAKEREDAEDTILQHVSIERPDTGRSRDTELQVKSSCASKESLASSGKSDALELVTADSDWRRFR